MADIDTAWRLPKLPRIPDAEEQREVTPQELRDARVRQDRAMDAVDAADVFACDDMLRALQAGDAELVGRMAVNLYRATVCGFALCQVTDKGGLRPKGYTDEEAIAKARDGVVLPWGL